MFSEFPSLNYHSLNVIYKVLLYFLQNTLYIIFICFKLWTLPVLCSEDVVLLTGIIIHLFKETLPMWIRKHILPDLNFGLSVLEIHSLWLLWINHCVCVLFFISKVSMLFISITAKKWQNVLILWRLYNNVS
jgi:hypothetical protein